MPGTPDRIAPLYELRMSRAKREDAKHDSKQGTWLTLIGIGKLIKVIALVTIGAIALKADGDGGDAVRHWIAVLGLHPGGQFVHAAIAHASGIDHHKLQEIGLGTFVYAALFLIEGVGLLLR